MVEVAVELHEEEVHLEVDHPQKEVHHVVDSEVVEQVAHREGLEAFLQLEEVPLHQEEVLHHREVPQEELQLVGVLHLPEEPEQQLHHQLLQLMMVTVLRVMDQEDTVHNMMVLMMMGIQQAVVVVENLVIMTMVLPNLLLDMTLTQAAAVVMEIMVMDIRQRLHPHPAQEAQLVHQQELIRMLGHHRVVINKCRNEQSLNQILPLVNST